MARPTIRSIGIVGVQSGARVGRHCRIQSHAFICDLVEIGDHCFISHGVMFINDTFGRGAPAGGDRSRYGRTAVGDNVSIGTNATILPVTICNDVVVGGGPGARPPSVEAGG